MCEISFENDFLPTCKSHGQLLCKAISQGSVKLWNSVLQYNVNINDLDNLGNSPLHLAAKNMIKKEAAALLLAQDCDINLCYNEDGKSPLLWAIKHDNDDIVNLALHNHADPNVLDKYTSNQSPLHIAATYNTLRTAELLLANDCDINLYNNDRQTPLIIATSNGSQNMVALLLSYGCSKQNYVTKIMSHHFKSLRLKADPNVLDKYTSNQSPLHIAATYATLRTAELLLTNDCDINLYNNDRQTPLIIATSNGSQNMVAQADPNVLDKYTSNQSPLHIAATYDKIRTAELMTLSHDFDINLYNNDRQTPLIIATSNGSQHLVSYYFLMDVEQNYVNANNESPFASLP
ncbi:unnamed protein product [Mytilus edulis]|uniref:Uncharacterized protein n=1 Tax=Mytilus edulis TaxID=6550 RepID=A0A8S3RIC1_MYTED|nr:unnamed protein product [Mytilus edulis]